MRPLAPGWLFGQNDIKHIVKFCRPPQPHLDSTPSPNKNSLTSTRLENNRGQRAGVLPACLASRTNRQTHGCLGSHQTDYGASLMWISVKIGSREANKYANKFESLLPVGNDRLYRFREGFVHRWLDCGCSTGVLTPDVRGSFRVGNSSESLPSVHTLHNKGGWWWAGEDEL